VSTDHARDVIYRKVHCGFQASFGEMTSRKGYVGGASGFSSPPVFSVGLSVGFGARPAVKCGSKVWSFGD
jgi:hypothetical protein